MRHIKQVLAAVSIGVPLLVWGVAKTGTPVAASAPIAQDQYASMPEAPGKAVTVQTCTKCHSITNVTSQHKDADGWTNTITKMVGYGAVGSDDDFGQILAYVTKYYGPDAAPPADAAHGKDAALPADAAHGKIAVNKATADQLATDLGLTGDEATAVVSYRTKNGDFKSVDDLKKVPNVDGKKIDAKKDDLQF